MAIGTYGVLTVEQAREKAHLVLAKINSLDEDPLALREKARTAPTVNDLAELYMKKWTEPRKRSASEDRRKLDTDVLPELGAKKVTEVTRQDIQALLDKIVERGSPIMSNRVLAVTRKMFNFALDEGWLEATPCARVKPRAAEKRRDRVLSEEELRLLLARLLTPVEKMRMSPSVRLALRFLLLTAQRSGEVVGAEWSEIDTASGWWVIPSERTKNNLTNRVPLSAQALLVLAEARLRHPKSRFVFPSPLNDAHMVDTALARAVGRSFAAIGTAHWTPHDLRRTAATYMASMGVPRLVISKLLNHVESSVTAIFDRASYDLEKRAALDQWGAKVDLLSAATGVEATPAAPVAVSKAKKSRRAEAKKPRKARAR
ncbi:MAG: tyrosine-type recombinase/integrase [Myxococcota bacterium]|jgi:integrase|nr:tyrosine-type recombinase/integrase [Myxococcota bacterium]